MTPVVVAIAGGSASGKSSLARDLVDTLGSEAALLPLDRFYRDLAHLTPARRARVNFDRPERIDWPLFLGTLDLLIGGRPAPLPVYDFATHTRVARTDLQAPARFLILDGLWLLRRRDVRRRCTLRLFIACPARERLRRRLRRDVAERGRDRREVLRRWNTFVEPGFRSFVAPQVPWADLVLNSPLPRHTTARLAHQLQQLAEAPP